MTTQKYAIVLAVVLAAALSGCADFRPGANQSTADAKIKADVETRLDQLSDLGPPGSIEVQARDHVVYLNGLVDVGLDKRLAESVARQAAGVTSVVNNIAVSHS